MLGSFVAAMFRKNSWMRLLDLYSQSWKLVKIYSWACIRRLYRHVTKNAILAFSASLSEFELSIRWSWN